MTDWKAVQRRLVSLGFSPGPIDGIPGRLTRGAVSRMQASRGLNRHGLVDASTLVELFGPPETSSASWMSVARSLLGTEERPGWGRSNPEILKMAERLDIDYPDDDVPWCGLFVAHCIASTLPDEALPASPLAARSWLRFGHHAKGTPAGGVAVFWRVSPDNWRGHVAFVARSNAEAVEVIGGNQGNRVSVASIPRARLLDVRWPATAEYDGPDGVLK
jgi:uncharacterized protein (TIGR02594 family)